MGRAGHPITARQQLPPTAGSRCLETLTVHAAHRHSIVTRAAAERNRTSGDSSTPVGESNQVWLISNIQALNEAVRYVLADFPHLAVLATIDPDGKPQTSVIFVKQNGDAVLFSTIKGRRKTLNMSRDPRVSLLIHGLPTDRPNQAGDGPNYVAISGTVELTDDPDGAFHREMYDLYVGGATPHPEPEAERVIVRMVPHHVYVPKFAAIFGVATEADEKQRRTMPTVPSDEKFQAYNQGIIGEFRANGGKVNQPPFPILLLTTTGARTGRQKTVPLGFGVDEKGRVFVVGSKAGAPKHPSWFHNLRANPAVTVEIGDSTYPARAVVTTGEERDRLYRIVSDGTSAYEQNTDRVFPVIVLEGVPAPA